jgi:hypothetical protein
MRSTLDGPCAGVISDLDAWARSIVDDTPVIEPDPLAEWVLAVTEKRS